MALIRACGESELAPGDARKEAAAEFKTRFSYTGLAGGKPPAP